MSKLVTQRIDKFNIILALCAKYPEIVEAVLAFKEGIAYLDAETTAIKQMRQPLLLPKKGTAAAKRAAKLNAADLLDPICGALLGYAERTNNLELKAAASFTGPIISKIRDEEMAQTCYALLKLANEHLDALKNYGYTDVEVKQATDAVADFEVYNPKPIENRGEGKVDRGSVLYRCRALNLFVNKQLKNTAKRFKITHPEFHEKLMIAMRSQNRGTRHTLTDEEKALRKAKREANAAEKAAAKAAAKAAKQAEAKARAAALQAQLDAMTKDKANADGQANGTPTPSEQDGSPEE